MKLTQRLFINNQEVETASQHVSLKLSQGGKALFVVKDAKAYQRFDLVRFDIGYEADTAPFFEGFIDKIEPAANGAHKVVVKELAGVLSNSLAISLEHPTLRDIFDEISDKTGLEFALPDADYTTQVIANFVTHGSGYQCLMNIARAFGVTDPIWCQREDQQIYFGAYADSHFYQKPMTIPLEFTSRQRSNSVTFVPFPMLRPGRIVFDKRITRLDFDGTEMTAYWVDEKLAQRKELESLLPEITAGYHLPMMGRIERVRDHATSGDTSNPFRPRYAADVQLLDENLVPNEAIPIYRSIPLPNLMPGQESGLLAYPLEGTLVEIAFAYGRSDRPIVRSFYGRDDALPSIEPGEQLQQQREEVSRRIDAAGNITDKTDQTLSTEAFKRVEKATHYQAEFSDHQLDIEGHSKENIIGKKVIQALGAIELLAGDNLELGSLGNMQVATAGELVEVIGKLRNIVVAQEDKLKVMGNKLATIEKDWEASAKNIRFKADLITLNQGKGVVQGDCICAFTGKPHSDLSATVTAGK